MVKKSLFNPLIYFITFLLLVTSAAAQKKDENARIDESKAVLWEQVDIPSRDLFYGPGGQGNAARSEQNYVYRRR